MRNIILLFFTTFFLFRSENYEIEILTDTIENKFLKFSVKNVSDSSLIFYYGDHYTDYKILDEENKEVKGKVMTAYSGEDYLEYQFDYSDSLIKKTMNCYDLSLKEAVLYLHYKNKHILISPNQSIVLDLPVITRNFTSAYEIDSTKKIFISLNTNFVNNFLPQKIKDSLRNKNIQVINPVINIKNISINKNKFFRLKKNLFIR